MKMRFQADNDLDQRIVSATRRLDPLIDFQTATALGLHGVDDAEVLGLAAREGRVLVSHDRRTMPGHFRAFILTQDPLASSSCLVAWRWAGLPSCCICFGQRATPKSTRILSTTFRS